MQPLSSTLFSSPPSVDKSHSSNPGKLSQRQSCVLQELLQRVVTILDKTFILSDLLAALMQRTDAQLVELVGGAARWTLFQDPEWIRSEIETQVNPLDFPPDIDVRIRTSTKPEMCLILVENYLTEQTGLDDQTINTTAFSKRSVSPDQDFSIIAFSNIEIIFTEKLKREFLFSFDNTALSLLPEQKLLHCSKQGLLDFVQKNVRVDSPQEVNFNGWPRLVSYLSRGFSLADPEAAKILLNKTLREKKRLSTLLIDCISNHHPNEREAANVCVFFNACQMLKGDIPWEETRQLFYTHDFRGDDFLSLFFQECRQNCAPFGKLSLALTAFSLFSPHAQKVGDRSFFLPFSKGLFLFFSLPNDLRTFFEKLANELLWKPIPQTFPLQDADPCSILGNNPIAWRSWVPYLEKMAIGNHPTQRALGKKLLQSAPKQQTLALATSLANDRRIPASLAALLTTHCSKEELELIVCGAQKLIQERDLKAIATLIKEGLAEKIGAAKLQELLLNELLLIVEEKKLQRSLIVELLEIILALPQVPNQMPHKICRALCCLYRPNAPLPEKTIKCLQTALPNLFEILKGRQESAEALELFFIIERFFPPPLGCSLWAFEIELCKTATPYMLQIEKFLSKAIHNKNGQLAFIELIHFFILAQIALQDGKKALNWIEKQEKSRIPFYLQSPLFLEDRYISGTASLLISHKDELPQTLLLTFFNHLASKEASTAAKMLISCKERLQDHISGRTAASLAEYAPTLKEAFYLLGEFSSENQDAWFKVLQKFLPTHDFQILTNTFAALDRQQLMAILNLDLLTFEREAIYILLASTLSALMKRGANQLELRQCITQFWKNENRFSIEQKEELWLLALPLLACSSENILWYLGFKQLDILVKNATEQKRAHFKKLLPDFVEGSKKFSKKLAAVHLNGFINSLGWENYPCDKLLPLLKYLFSLKLFHLCAYGSSFSYDKLTGKSKSQLITWMDAILMPELIEMKLLMPVMLLFTTKFAGYVKHIDRLLVKELCLPTNNLDELKFQIFKSISLIKHIDHPGKNLECLPIFIDRIATVFTKFSCFEIFANMITTFLLDLHITYEVKVTILEPKPDDPICKEIPGFVGFRCRKRACDDPTGRDLFFHAFSNVLKTLLRSGCSCEKTQEKLLCFVAHNLIPLLEDFPKENSTIIDLIVGTCFHNKAFKESFIEGHFARCSQLYARANKNFKGDKHFEKMFFLYLFIGDDLKFQPGRTYDWHRRQINLAFSFYLSLDLPAVYLHCLKQIRNLKNTLLKDDPHQTLFLYHNVFAKLSESSITSIDLYLKAFTSACVGLLQTDVPNSTHALGANFDLNARNYLNQIFYFIIDTLLKFIKKSSADSNFDFMNILHMNLRIGAKKEAYSFFTEIFSQLATETFNVTVNLIEQDPSRIDLVEKMWKTLLAQPCPRGKYSLFWRTDIFQNWIYALSVMEYPGRAKIALDTLEKARLERIFEGYESTYDQIKENLLHQLIAEERRSYSGYDETLAASSRGIPLLLAQTAPVESSSRI